MFRLVKFELYKIFFNKFFIIVAVVLLGLFIEGDLREVRAYYRDYGNFNEYYNEYYKGKEGPVTYDEYIKAEAELQKIQSKTNYNKAEFIESEYQSSIRSSYSLNEQRLLMAKQSKNYADTQLNKYGQNSFEYKYAKLNATMLSNLAQPGLYFTKPWFDMIDIAALAYFLVTLVILVVSPIFAREYSNKTDSIILTTKKGRYTVASAKVVSCVLTSIILSFAFFASQSLIYILGLGVQGYNVAIQLSFNYLMSPFNFTFVEFFFIEVLFVTLGAVCIGLVTLFFSSLFKKQMISVFLAGLLFLIPPFIIGMGLKIDYSTVFGRIIKNIQNFSFYNVVMVKDLFKDFKAYNIFDYPVLSCFVIPCFIIILTVIATILTHKIFENHQVK